MNYNYKYIKYKLKYIKLKELQYGGKKDNIVINIINSMKKIGSFVVNNNVVVGGNNQFRTIKSLKSGIYNAYVINNDSLMIVHNDYGNITRYIVDEWIWKPTNIYIRSGNIGFFDSEEIEQKMKIQTKPFTNFHIIKQELIENPEGIPNRLSGPEFGVIGKIGIGVSPINVYIIDDNRAILVGIDTAELYSSTKY